MEEMKAQSALQAETNKNLLTLSKSEGPQRDPTRRSYWIFYRHGPLWGPGSRINPMGIVGFCFGIGLMLAVKTVNNLEELIRR